jgi:hypothetical protein
MDYMPYQKRLDYIQGFDQMVSERTSQNWQPYFLNFMFNRIPGKESTRKTTMTGEVMRVYTTLITNIVRKPHSTSWMSFSPLFFGCPDFPVAKRDKDLVRNVIVNDGLHFNGCLLLPPKRKCRLKEHLDDHFKRNQERYYRDGYPLDRLHATYIEDGTMIDYAFKQLKRSNVSIDDILVLPRANSEFSRGRGLRKQ